MSRLSTDLEVLDDELTSKIMKPRLIANGYYTELTNALDAVYADVHKVHALIEAVREAHEKHTPAGPMSLCEEICRRVDAL